MKGFIRQYKKNFTEEIIMREKNNGSNQFARETESFEYSKAIKKDTTKQMDMIRIFMKGQLQKHSLSLNDNQLNSLAFCVLVQAVD
jgi:hypothetical protein